jgi:ADP-ribose pyrophosphatase
MSELFRKIQSKEIYHGRVINLKVDTIRYKDKDIKWEIVEQGEAVVIIPYLGNRTFLVLEQFRYTVGKFIWEFPAGRIEKGEDLAIAANRELEEESGYRAHRLKKLLSYYPSPGVCTEVMHLMLAQDLVEAHTALPDDDEIIRTKTKTFDEIEKMILTGEIQDAKTILAFFYYKIYEKNIS